MKRIILLVNDLHAQMDPYRVFSVPSNNSIIGVSYMLIFVVTFHVPVDITKNFS